MPTLCWVLGINCHVLKETSSSEGGDPRVGSGQGLLDEATSTAVEVQKRRKWSQWGIKEGFLQEEAFRPKLEKEAIKRRDEIKWDRKAKAW
jgi:hypothetical protein